MLVLGVVMIRSHVLSWRREQQEPALDLKHYRARYRRRMQMSGLLIILGILIAVGDALIPWQKAPLLFAFYWGAVLLLLLWLIAVAVGDILATGAHSRVSLARIQHKQRELEEQLARMKDRKSNGRKPTE